MKFSTFALANAKCVAFVRPSCRYPMDRYKSYMNFDDVAQDEDAYKIINDSTFSVHSPLGECQTLRVCPAFLPVLNEQEFFDFPKDGDFHDRNDYEKLWLKKLSEGTENLKDIIDIGMVMPGI